MHISPRQRHTILALLLSINSASASEIDSDMSVFELNQQLILATVWVEKSGEFKALSHQAFNLARMKFDSYITAKNDNKPLAVIVDVDETVISNTRYEAWLIADGVFHSSKRQLEWANAAIAPPLPGAVEFLQHVSDQGGEVFYVTNRKDDTKTGTLTNLQRFNFPFADSTHLLTKSDTSDKEPRRAAIAKNYDVVLLIGDNLKDFSADFDSSTFEETDRAVELNSALFGDRYIVLPNPMYGDWEAKLYEGDWRLPNSEKSKRRLEALNPWRGAK